MANQFTDVDAEQAFKEMDADHDGLVTLQEFTQFLKHFMGDELVDAVGDKVHELFGELDQDHDGKLTLQEVKSGYLKLEA